MEKIIFFGLVIPIIAYVLYLGATAIMEGFKAKEANKAEKEEAEQDANLNSISENSSLSEELEKLNHGFQLERPSCQSFLPMQFEPPFDDPLYLRENQLQELMEHVFFLVLFQNQCRLDH